MYSLLSHLAPIDRVRLPDPVYFHIGWTRLYSGINRLAR
jgi:hypothetical protein